MTRKRAPELFVGRHARVRLLQEQRRLQALEVVVLVDLAGERGEGLVEDVGRDAGDRPAEDVALDQADDLDQLGVADRALVVVVHDLEQERVDDVDLELVEVGDRLAQRRVVGAVEGELDPVLRVLVDVGDEVGRSRARSTGPAS